MTAFTALSCLTCAKAFEHAGANAAGLAILFMLAIVIPVVTTIGIMIFRIARREKAHFDPQFEDSFEA
ncbi:hypothetical protein [Rubritalea tangerina]|uniref:Uncharacterized protein n=1 Tax=Rubritalea tangerina TaxID=430798 RepID=A0ABW4ZD82_9BACT